MSTFKNISSSVLVLLLVASCKTVSPQSSQAKHDAGRFLNNNDVTLWGNFSEAEYQTLQAKTSSSKMLPIDHDLTKRMQFWADTIRTKMIEVMPGLASIPAPQVRILKSDSVNAFAQSIRVAIVADIATSSSLTTVIPLGQDIVLGKQCSSYCPEFKGDLEAKRALVEESQKRINQDCKVESTNGILQLAESCLAPSSSVYQGPKRFNRYNASQVVNYITILSESIKKMPETDLVVTLAHELGHYYLAHPVYLDAPDAAVPYNYLYIRSDRPGTGKPVPLAANDPNYSLLREFDEAIDFNFPVFEGQKYPTVLDLALAQSVSDGLNRGGIVDRCVTGTDLQKCLSWGYEVSKPGQALVEWAFHAKADLFNPTSVATGAALALKFEEALAKHGSVLRASDLSTLKEALAKYIGRGAPAVNLSDDKDETIDSFLPSYAERAKVAIDENPQIIARLTQTVFDKGLGFYTAEQEADDVATEILYELGFEPELVVNNWLHFLDRSAEPQSKKDACRANYATGFKTPVWIGLSTEPHHGACYRAYNAFHEMKIHHDFFEKNKGAKRPVAPGGNWDELVATMKGKSFQSIPTK